MRCQCIFCFDCLDRQLRMGRLECPLCLEPKSKPTVNVLAVNFLEDFVALRPQKKSLEKTYA